MFIPEWLLAVAITMFVIDIFLPTEILSWISLLMISVYVVWKIDPPILWGILIFIITFSSVTIFYYLFLRRFISPIVSMLQSIIDLMVRYNIKDRDLREKQFIKLDDGTVLSYDFYQHVSDDEDNWNVPTDVLYGIYDEVVFYSTMIEFLETHPSCKLTVKSDAQHYFHTEEEMQFIKEWILRGLEQ